MAEQFNSEQETNRLLRQSWEYPGGVNMLAREISSLIDVFFRTQTIGGSIARLDATQTFIQPNTFAATLFAAATGAADAVSITHTGSGGWALKVSGREGAFYNGIFLTQQNASLNNGYSFDIAHNQNTHAMRVLHGGSSGYAIQIAGRPCINYDGFLFTQQTAGTYSLQVNHAVSGTAVVITHTLGGLALAISGGVTITGNLTVDGNISSTQTVTANAYVEF